MVAVEERQTGDLKPFAKTRSVFEMRMEMEECPVGIPLQRRLAEKFVTALGIRVCAKSH